MPIIALFFIAFASLVIVRVGATALMMTGLPRPVAEFQAISCFFGVGFTTAESEVIVNHPVRRRIATHLIVIGNLGITTALGALIVSFMQNEPDWLDEFIVGEGGAVPFLLRLGITLAGVLAIAAMFRPRFVRVFLERAIRASLVRTGVARGFDYEAVLHSKDGYVVAQQEIPPGHPLIGSTLASAALGSRGVLVLGVLRVSGEHEAAPGPDTRIEQGDVLTVYGHEQKIHAATDMPRGAVPGGSGTADGQPNPARPVSDPEEEP